MVSSRFLGEGVPFVSAVFTVLLKVEPHWHLQGGSGGVGECLYHAAEHDCNHFLNG